MKRDMELIRKVLLAVQDGNPNLPIDGYSEDEVKYHRKLAIEAELIKGAIRESGRNPREIPAGVIVKELTWSGHDFIDAIATESNWQRVKDFLKDSGKQITLETVKVAVLQLFGYGQS
jgi:hypothetical protein